MGIENHVRFHKYSLLDILEGAIHLGLTQPRKRRQRAAGFVNSGYPPETAKELANHFVCPPITTTLVVISDAFKHNREHDSGISSNITANTRHLTKAHLGHHHS